MRKKPIISVTYGNERISIKKKKQLTLHKMCVTPLSCVVDGPMYGRFIGCTQVNGFPSLTLYRAEKNRSGAPSDYILKNNCLKEQILPRNF